MKKTVFLFLYLAITAALLIAVLDSAAKKQKKFPATQEEYETMAETALRSADGVKTAYGAAGLALQHDAIMADGEAVVRMADDFLIPFHTVSGFHLDRAVERIEALRAFCAGLDIPVFYVSYPSKGTYTEANAEDYGFSSNEKETRAQFLARIRALDIPVLDVAAAFKARGFSQQDVFYKTDHHWKTRMGLIAAGEIAALLDGNITAKLDPGSLAEDRFRTTVYKQKWLGETGRKVSSVWARTLEDYVLYEPDFETAIEYYVPAAKISDKGTFSDLIDWKLLNGETNLYQDSLHYAYMRDVRQVAQLRNKMMSGAKILLIRDSYSIPVAPFLALSCGDLFCWDMRSNKDTVFDYIDKHRFDAVVIAYTDFWRDEMYDFK